MRICRDLDSPGHRRLRMRALVYRLRGSLPYWHVSCGGLQALAPWDTIPAARVCRARDIELAHMLRESPVGGSYPYARTEDSR